MTTGTTTRSRAAQDYLDGVSAALADLPEDDRADLLELAAHLDEIEAETDAPLTTRLGTPAEYAAELRATAGLPPGRSRTDLGAATLARLRTFRRRKEVVAAEAFVASLRPAWWVARAWVALAVLPWWGQPRWVPQYGGIPVPDLGPDEGSLLALLLAVVLSSQVGRHEPLRRPWLRRAVLVATVMAALVTLPMLTSLADSRPPYRYIEVGPVHRVPSDGVYAGGTQVWNIYP